MARPDIDADQVEKLAGIGCKTEEIANFFGCSTDTIQRRFAAELIKGRASVRLSLRRWQLEAAKRGNATLLIWLGKQMLGQIDSPVEIKTNPLEGMTPQEKLLAFKQAVKLLEQEVKSGSSAT